MAGVDGCVRYIGRHGGRLEAACAVGLWLMWVGSCEVQMEKRWVAGQWGEVHGNIHEMYCGVSWST